MRHHQYKPDFNFVIEPAAFNKYTEKSLLQYCLGATMYMPGTRDFVPSIVERKQPGLTSIVLCFEDACRLEEVPAAELNAIRLLDILCEKLQKKSLAYSDIPLIIFRVRNQQQFERFSAMLKPEHMKLVCAFNFPKCNMNNADAYFSHLEMLNEKFGEIIYGMPILEDYSIAYKETRVEELVGLKKILDNYKRYVLNIRVGGTDFSSCFGVRRTMNNTIYDMITVRDCLQDILNVFARQNDYIISAPVWEYFRVDKSTKFKTVDKYGLNIQKSLIKHTPMFSDATDGLLRELLLDMVNGFIGKTIIHPTHLNYVNGMLAVTREEYEDATQVLNTPGGVIKSRQANKMNEIGPHKCWAEKLYMRARAYGVIHDETGYLELIK